VRQAHPPPVNTPAITEGAAAPGPAAPSESDSASARRRKTDEVLGHTGGSDSRRWWRTGLRGAYLTTGPSEIQVAERWRTRPTLLAPSVCVVSRDRHQTATSGASYTVWPRFDRRCAAARRLEASRGDERARRRRSGFRAGRTSSAVLRHTAVREQRHAEYRVDRVRPKRKCLFQPHLHPVEGILKVDRGLHLW
jgi:hypothetical protein